MKNGESGSLLGQPETNLPDTATFDAFVQRRGTLTLGRMNSPQQLSRQAIDEFKAIYRDEFGVNLSDDEAQEIAMRLLRFFGILVKPIGTNE